MDDQPNFVGSLRGTGALFEEPDPKNYKHEEIFGVAKAPIWLNKSPDNWKRYGNIRDQYSSGSCVMQTVALILGIENLREEGKFVELSARPGYAKNFVAPDGGMYPSVGFKYGSDLGCPLEVQMRSQLIDEQSMRVYSDEKNSDLLVAKILRGGKFVAIDKFNLDAICSVLDRNKGVGISVRFQNELSPDKPLLSPTGRYGHEITLVDYCLYNGVKGFIYQNSWGASWGFKGLGFMPLNQFDLGTDSVFYFEELLNQIPGGDVIEPPKPKYNFTQNLILGQSGPDVAMLQRCLGYLKDADGYLFPLVQSPTGYYGGITRAAVKRFQSMSGLVQSGNVDTPTRLKLNETFN